MSKLYEANKIEIHKESKTVRALKDVSILQPRNRSTLPLVLMRNNVCWINFYSPHLSSWSFQDFLGRLSHKSKEPIQIFVSLPCRKVFFRWKTWRIYVRAMQTWNFALLGGAKRHSSNPFHYQQHQIKINLPRNLNIFVTQWFSFICRHSSYATNGAIECFVARSRDDFRVRCFRDKDVQWGFFNKVSRVRR